jgi:uncharacterized protein (DUF1684 family)
VSGYERTLDQWRLAREARLKADDGWLTLVGLFWLDQGANVAGSSENAQVVLPRGRAPERSAVFTLEGNTVTFRPESGVRFTIEGRPAGVMQMRPDTSPKPTVLSLGTLRLILLERSGRYAIRVKDNASPERSKFVGLRWYPVDPSWRVSARFMRYASPRRIPVQTAAGTVDRMESPGYVEFTREGKRFRLEPFLEDNELFFVFRDATTGKSTYGAGRFIYAPLPANGTDVLDFNKAENPPCAFTPYATCPIAPKQNRLDFAVTAGEMKYPGGHH